jgi:hypothetical protein
VSLNVEKDDNGINHANATKPAPELAEELRRRFQLVD